MPEQETATTIPFYRLDPHSTALLVIDMQRYFVHQEYPFGKWILQLDPEEAEAYFERVKHRYPEHPTTSGLLSSPRSPNCLHRVRVTPPRWSRHARLGSA
jgi:nicotinamidase-related amidase